MRYRNPLALAATGVALSLLGSAAVPAQTPTPVVASFSILGDMAERIGGPQVDVVTLVGPGGDAHVYQPTPQAAQAVSNAELFIVNGLQFEGWLDRLVDASDFTGQRVVVTDGVEPIAFGEAADASAGHSDHGHEGHDDHSEPDHAHEGHDDHDEPDHGHDDHGHDHGHDHGASDPHAWQSVPNAITYVENITAALVAADPAHADRFEQRAQRYIAELEALDERIRATIASLPADQRTVVTSHDAFQYFADEYGLTFFSPQGVSTESEASAGDVAALIEAMRERNVSAVFFENITDTRLLERIADETGARIGGTLYPGALSESDGPAPSYIEMMEHNAETLEQALGADHEESQS